MVNPEAEIVGEGAVKNNGKFIAGYGLLLTGMGVGLETIFDPLINKHPAGMLPGLRVVGGAILGYIGFHMITHVERYPSEEQMEEYMQPQLPLDMDNRGNI